MRFHFLLKTAFGGLSLLTATALAIPQDLPVKSVSVPAYNIITDTLFNLTPLVAGKRDIFYMKQICDLARGDASQQQVDQRLRQNKMDPQQLASSGIAGMLVTQGGRADRQLACTAYLASSLLLPTSMADYRQQTTTFTRWLPWRSRDDDKTPGGPGFDQARFNTDARIQLALARATAQLYAVVAQNIPTRSSAEWATRQQQIAEILRHYAPEYLKSIDSFYRAESNTPLTLESATDDGYSVRNANGNRLVKTGENIELFSRGVTWLGGGKIIGRDYFVDIAIIPAPAKPAAVNEAPPKKK